MSRGRGGFRRKGIALLDGSQKMDIHVSVWVNGATQSFQLTVFGVGTLPVETLGSGQIPTERNRWVGGNRGGWSSPEYDRLIDTFHHTLARPERLAALRQMLRIYLEDMPRVSYYYPAGPFVYVTALQGPATAAPESRVAWNVHEWEFK